MVIKVIFLDVYYWDIKDGKVILLFKMVGLVLFGNIVDIGVEGKLKL